LSDHVHHHATSSSRRERRLSDQPPGTPALASAAAGGTLNIAYNVNLPSFDPNTGPSSVNPTLQSIYRSVFNNYIGQRPDLSFEPALLTAWGWNEDKTKVWMDVREDVFWHDGSRLTPDDIVWSIQRNAKPDSGNPVSFKIDGTSPPTS
jgi:peptide/nickel transport system substrate-binding protein